MSLTMCVCGFILGPAVVLQAGVLLLPCNRVLAEFKGSVVVVGGGIGGLATALGLQRVCHKALWLDCGLF